MREIFVRLLIPYLGGVTHVAFPAGKMLDEAGGGQLQLPAPSSTRQTGYL